MVDWVRAHVVVVLSVSAQRLVDYGGVEQTKEVSRDAKRWAAQCRAAEKQSVEQRVVAAAQLAMEGQAGPS